MPLFLLLIALPLIEIALFIKVGGLIGLWPTIAIVLLTAAAGTMLLRAQGLAALGQVQTRLQAGENPAPALAHGALILVAGLLLLTPGFFTDALGLLLLVPPVRAAVIRLAAARMTVVHAGAAFGQRPGSGPHRDPSASPGTVDGEYEVVEPGAGREHGGAAARPGASGWTRVAGESDRR